MRRATLVACAFVLVAIAAPVYGQVLHADGPLPSFEVATIKPGDSPGRQDTQNEVFISGQSIRTVIRTAYNIPLATGRIVGGPDWLPTDKYSIDAKIEDSLAAAMQKMRTDKRDEQIHLMEQSLLADRFKLKAHFEMREMPVYALVVAKGGAKLTPAKYLAPTGVWEPARNGHPEDVHKGILVSPKAGSIIEMQLRGYTLQELAYLLTANPEIDGRTVVDHTGIAGVYDLSITLMSRRQDSAALANDGDQMSVFTSLQEQLGLKLVSGKEPVEVLVIDSIERPSEN